MSLSLGLPPGYSFTDCKAMPMLCKDSGYLGMHWSKAFSSRMLASSKHRYGTQEFVFMPLRYHTWIDNWMVINYSIKSQYVFNKILLVIHVSTDILGWIKNRCHLGFFFFEIWDWTGTNWDSKKILFEAYSDKTRLFSVCFHNVVNFWI